MKLPATSLKKALLSKTYEWVKGSVFPGFTGLAANANSASREMKADITGIDVSDEKLALAKSLGARDGLNSASTKVTKELRAKGGVHVALVTSAAKAAYDLAFSCLRPTGTLLVVGLPSESLCF